MRATRRIVALGEVNRRFGILTFAGGPFSEIARCWREAEQLGFNSAWVVDTFSYAGVVDYEPWTLLAALARETSRLRIGTLVTHIAFRHPTVLAAQALTVDHLSGGRVELGIGTGGPEKQDNAAVGAEEWSGEERTARLADQLAVLDRSLRGDLVDHVGPFYRAEGVRLVAPVQRPRPPLVIAAQAPRTLRLAARYGDGWNSPVSDARSRSPLYNRPPLIGSQQNGSHRCTGWAPRERMPKRRRWHGRFQHSMAARYGGSRRSW